MTTKYESPAYRPLMEFLIETATPEAILAFRASDSWQQRTQQLLSKRHIGELTPKEEVELQRMQEIDQLETGLKAMCAAKLAGFSTADNDSSTSAK